MQEHKGQTDRTSASRVNQDAWTKGVINNVVKVVLMSPTRTVLQTDRGRVLLQTGRVDTTP